MTNATHARTIEVYEVSPPVACSDFDGTAVQVEEIHRNRRADDGEVSFEFYGRRVTRGGAATGLYGVRILSAATEQSVMAEAGL